MSNKWLSTLIKDCIAIAKNLTPAGSPTVYHVYADSLSWGIGKQVSLAQTDVVVLFEQMQSSLTRAMNSNRSYTLGINFTAHIYATRAQTADRNLDAVAEISELLISKIVNYHNEDEKIYNIYLTEPPLIIAIGGQDGVPAGSFYTQVKFNFTKTINYPVS